MISPDFSAPLRTARGTAMPVFPTRRQEIIFTACREIYRDYDLGPVISQMRERPKNYSREQILSVVLEGLKTGHRSGCALIFSTPPKTM